MKLGGFINTPIYTGKTIDEQLINLEGIPENPVNEKLIKHLNQLERVVAFNDLVSKLSINTQDIYLGKSKLKVITTPESDIILELTKYNAKYNIIESSTDSIDSEEIIEEIFKILINYTYEDINKNVKIIRESILKKDKIQKIKTDLTKNQIILSLYLININKDKIQKYYDIMQNYFKNVNDNILCFSRENSECKELDLGSLNLGKDNDEIQKSIKNIIKYFFPLCCNKKETKNYISKIYKTDNYVIVNSENYVLYQSSLFNKETNFIILQLTDNFTINRIVVDKENITYQTDIILPNLEKYEISHKKSINFVLFGSNIIRKLFECSDSINNLQLFNLLKLLYRESKTGNITNIFKIYDNVLIQLLSLGYFFDINDLNLELKKELITTESSRIIIEESKIKPELFNVTNSLSIIKYFESDELLKNFIIKAIELDNNNTILYKLFYYFFIKFFEKKNKCANMNLYNKVVYYLNGSDRPLPNNIFKSSLKQEYIEFIYNLAQFYNIIFTNFKDDLGYIDIFLDIFMYEYLQSPSDFFPVNKDYVYKNYFKMRTTPVNLVLPESKYDESLGVSYYENPESISKLAHLNDKFKSINMSDSNFKIINYTSGHNFKKSKKQFTDCADITMLNIMNYLLLEHSSDKFNITKLPDKSKIKDFYTKYDSLSKILSLAPQSYDDWYNIVEDVEGMDESDKKDCYVQMENIENKNVYFEVKGTKMLTVFNIILSSRYENYKDFIHYYKPEAKVEETENNIILDSFKINIINAHADMKNILEKSCIELLNTYYSINDIYKELFESNKNKNIKLFLIFCGLFIDSINYYESFIILHNEYSKFIQYNDIYYNNYNELNQDNTTKYEEMEGIKYSYVDIINFLLSYKKYIIINILFEQTTLKLWTNQFRYLVFYCIHSLLNIIDYTTEKLFTGQEEIITKDKMLFILNSIFYSFKVNLKYIFTDDIYQIFYDGNIVKDEYTEIFIELFQEYFNVNKLIILNGYELNNDIYITKDFYKKSMSSTIHDEPKCIAYKKFFIDSGFNEYNYFISLRDDIKYRIYENKNHGVFKNKNITKLINSDTHYLHVYSNKVLTKMIQIVKLFDKSKLNNIETLNEIIFITFRLLLEVNTMNKILTTIKSPFGASPFGASPFGASSFGPIHFDPFLDDEQPSFDLNFIKDKVNNYIHELQSNIMNNMEIIKNITDNQNYFRDKILEINDKTYIKTNLLNDKQQEKYNNILVKISLPSNFKEIKDRHQFYLSILPALFSVLPAPAETPAARALTRAETPAARAVTPFKSSSIFSEGNIVSVNGKTGEYIVTNVSWNFPIKYDVMQYNDDTIDYEKIYNLNNQDLTLIDVNKLSNKTFEVGDIIIDESVKDKTKKTFEKIRKINTIIPSVLIEIETESGKKLYNSQIIKVISSSKLKSQKVSIGGNLFYKNKYLKYKQKYIQLKKNNNIY